MTKSTHEDAALGQKATQRPEQPTPAPRKPNLVLVGTTVALVRGGGGDKYDAFFMVGKANLGLG
jgi:hypothetical protein